MQALSGRRFLPYLLVVIWLGTVGTGMAMLMQYERTAGSSGTIPPHWPQDSLIKRSTDERTLLVFLHPRCPCSRATVGQLSQLLSRSKRPVHTQVVVYCPRGETEAWWSTGMVRTAAALPAVALVVDEGGREALRFGALTSGHALLYAPSGQLLFQGGITVARGQEGGNLGYDRLAHLLETGTRTGMRRQPPESACVYGCPLQGLKAN